MLKRIRTISLSCIILLLLCNMNSFAGPQGNPGLQGNHYLLELTEDSDSKIKLNAIINFDGLINGSPHYISLLGLKPASVTQEYTNKDFHIFIPTQIVDKQKKVREVAVGEVWKIDANGLLPFLRQFHPGATVSLSGKRGAYAVLKSATDTHLEILFRFHADFNLSVMPEKEMDKVEQWSDEIASIKEKAVQDILEVEEKTETLKTLDVSLQSLKEELEAKREEIRSLKVKLESGDEKTDIQKTFELTDLTKELDTRFDALEQKLDKQLIKFRDSLSATLQKQLTEQFDTIEKELVKNLTTVLTKELNNRITTLKAELTENLTTLLTKELDTKFTEWTQVSNEQLQELNTAISKQEQRLNTINTQLNRLNTIYLTPNKFIGRLVINRKTKSVSAFSLSVPVDDTNATISSLTLINPVEIYIPQMELTSHDVLIQSILERHFHSRFQ